jgi:putative ABC transport system permease protein
MILKNIKVALRYLSRNPTFTTINLLGLTMGFVSFLIIVLYVQDELSFDSMHPDADHIYRVIQHEQLTDGTIRDVAQIAAQVGPTAAKEFPEVDEAVRLSVWGRVSMGNDPDNLYQQRLMQAGEAFLKVFDFPLAEGDAATALQQPLSTVLTPEAAARFFGNQPALGKQIWTNITAQGKPVHLMVAGVLREQPLHTHLKFDMLISEATFRSVFPWYPEYELNDWNSNDVTTYLKVKATTNIPAFEQKLTNLVRSHYPVDREFKSTFTLQPIRDIHLSDGHVQERTEISAAVTKPFYLYSFALAGALLLLIACLNYLNLSTAAAFQRTREIGTRKSLGAQRKQLLLQFCGEALMLSTIALFLAVIVGWLIVPYVNALIEKQLSLTSIPIPWALGTVTLLLLAGLASSAYPAFVIASVKPTDALKKIVTVGKQGIPVRKIVVAAQFAISILMIASTLVVFGQLNYMRKKDLGLTVDNLLVIDINSGSMRDLDKVKASFGSLPEVQSVSASSRVPGEWKSFPISSVRKDVADQSLDMIYVGVDGDFLSTYGIPLLQGRALTQDRSDSLKVVLTELAVTQLGLTDPIGKVIEIPEYRFGASVEKLETPLRVEVVGVAGDFHFESLRKKMMPVIFAYHDTELIGNDYYTLKIHTTDWSETISKLKQAYKVIEPVVPMEYNFLNERFADFYRADEKRGALFLVFSMEIILIACLGLFALVSFSVERRTREIGIRKVLGASVSSIVSIIGREFIGVLLFAMVIALPLSWFLMDRWLQEFAYRVEQGPATFLLASGIAVLIAVVTICARTFRTANSNPVRWLRSD